MRSNYFIFAVILTAQAFNLDFLPKRPQALTFENMLTEKALDKALTNLLKESRMQHSMILKALKKNVEDQIMKEFEEIHADTWPKSIVARNKAFLSRLS